MAKGKRRRKARKRAKSSKFLPQGQPYCLSSDPKKRVRTPAIGVNPEWIRNGWDISTFEETIKVPIRKSEKVQKVNKLGVRSEERVYSEDKPFFWPRKVKRTTEYTHKGVVCGTQNKKKGD